MSIRSNVYTGPWIDYSRGRFYGATITISDAAATALISFLAVLITHTGASSFKILRFVLHQSRRYLAQTTFVEAQNRLLVRSETDIGMFTSLLALCHRWRRRNMRPWRRTALLIVIVLLHALCFIAAGVAVSLVADGKNARVLAMGEECGIWMWSEPSLRAVAAWQKEMLKSATAAQAYKRLCYGDDDQADASECRVMMERRLEWTGTSNAGCPFEGMCLEGPAAAYRLETGLQSSEVLGINSPTPMQWEARWSCAPLDLEPYKTIKAGAGEAGEDIYTYSLGSIGMLSPYTYTASTLTPVLDPGLKLNLQTNTPWIGNGTLQLHPIPALDLPHKSTTLMFISTSGLSYHSPTDDPIFAAHNRSSNFSMPGYESFPVYHADHPVSLLACASDTRICNPRTTSCTPWFAPLETPTNIAENKPAEDVAVLLGATLMKINPYLTGIAQGAPVLAVNDLIYAGSAEGVEREQWKRELEHLFEIALATAQLDTVRLAKESWKRRGEGWKNMLSEGYRGVCGMVMWREEGFSGVSVLGLGVCLVGCMVVIGVAGWVEGVVARCGEGGRRGVERWREEKGEEMRGRGEVRKVEVRVIGKRSGSMIRSKIGSPGACV